MLDQTAAAAQVLQGSWAPIVQVDAWYDGQIVLDSVPVTAVATTEDATRAILGSGSVTAAAADDSLIPTSWDSPLACYGSELHIRVGVPLAGEQVEWYSLGWFVITDFDCQDWWQEYRRPDGSTQWACRGTQVSVNLDDRWELVDQAQFAVPEQPASLTSAIAEIERLADGIVPVDDLTAVTDLAIPATLTYSNSRTDAIQQLAALLGQQARMSRDGALTLVPVDPAGAPVWTVTVTDDAQAARILAYTRKGDRAGLYNQFVSSGQSVGGTPVQAVVTTGSGPLRFGGPLGRLPLMNNSPLITTDTSALADADAQQAKYGGAQTVLIPVTIPANPALETGDVIELDLPNGVTLTGPVQAINRGNLLAASMQVTVKISREQLWGAAA